VIISLEDGPTTPDSRLYFYVGQKQSFGTGLHRNGLDNGRLYVFAAESGPATEAVNGAPGATVQGEWKLIPNAETLNETQLETAADAAGAFGFVRVEDGAFKPGSNRDFYFVTTGEGPPFNALGRVYHLRLGATPLADARLTTLLNADLFTPAQDGPMSPDNVDVRGNWIAIDEDGTANSRPEMEARNRDGSIWLVNRHNPSNRHRVAELVGRSEGGRDNVHTGAGIWETSGIIDTSHLFEGRGTWLFDVQAHSPTAPPGSDTSEDGQLLLLRRGH
jgi:secreted PhoX family phosphatase